MKPVTNIIVAGLGGQGVLKASDVLCDALFHSGYEVKKSEVHGEIIGGNAWVEGCRIAAPLRLAGGNVVIGIEVNEPLSLPENGCVDVLRGRNRDGEKIWFVRFHDNVLDVPEGRVFEMHQSDGCLIIRQSVQARNREDSQNIEQRFEMRYFLTPYRQGAAEGKEPSITDSRYTEFFQTEGKLETGTGRVSSHIVRFDLHQPVVFHYSANTPPEYVEAVKDGILYWNRVFGKEVVQAKKAPEGVTAPDAKLNIIQWVPWDNAGFAYADVLMDPITGQSLHDHQLRHVGRRFDS